MAVVVAVDSVQTAETLVPWAVANLDSGRPIHIVKARTHLTRMTSVPLRACRGIPPLPAWFPAERIATVVDTRLSDTDCAQAAPKGSPANDSVLDAARDTALAAGVRAMLCGTSLATSHSHPKRQG